MPTATALIGGRASRLTSRDPLGVQPKDLLRSLLPGLRRLLDTPLPTCWSYRVVEGLTNAALCCDVLCGSQLYRLRNLPLLPPPPWPFPARWLP